MFLRGEADTVKRLKLKCNGLIELVNKLQLQNTALTHELERLRAMQTSKIPVQIPQAEESDELLSYYSAFTQIVQSMIRENDVIMPKLVTKTNKDYRHLEAARFKARAGQLLQAFDERKFLNFCLAFGLLQRIGNSITTVAHRRADEEDAGAPVRVYRVSTELIDYLANKEGEAFGID